MDKQEESLCINVMKQVKDCAECPYCVGAQCGKTSESLKHGDAIPAWCPFIGTPEPDEPSDNERAMYIAIKHYVMHGCDCMLHKAWQVVNEDCEYEGCDITPCVPL